MKVTGFNHSTLRISSLDRSLPFYTDILGMKLVHKGRTDVYLEWGAAWICLIELHRVEPDLKPSVDEASITELPCEPFAIHTGLDHLAFSIEEADFAEAVERLRAANVPIIRGPLYRGGGWSVNFLDPDGIQLEIFTGTLADRMKNWT
ncbi:VOC family protein [Paenibacillus radicis (ex Xue et al. 2023)]|uniref:VOC family protein n=1 Tax=Paenibacillus radicis (ex Xue et al. 2023) TaxID=2972489 RepID=A0ABT1YFD8_9BACL|nr:VOC family protein [Paenibacillus radicis (ex Xue et al. 2023)]MCR8631915.1 VOC family protein [Paenibacillus radicis (ex Xue et al. 2023)]